MYPPSRHKVQVPVRCFVPIEDAAVLWAPRLQLAQPLDDPAAVQKQFPTHRRGSRLHESDAAR